MKKKSLKLRWPYFFGQRIHGSDSSGPDNMPELIKPESDWQRAENVSVIEAILRWADDGGQMLDLGKLPKRQVKPGYGSKSHIS